MCLHSDGLVIDRVETFLYFSQHLRLEMPCEGAMRARIDEGIIQTPAISAPLAGDRERGQTDQAPLDARTAPDLWSRPQRSDLCHRGPGRSCR